MNDPDTINFQVQSGVCVALENKLKYMILKYFFEEISMMTLCAENNENGFGLSVIVVSFRSGPIIYDCLKCLVVDSAVSEIIVVDNGNRILDEKLLDDWAVNYPQIHVLRPNKNLGFSAACNLAVATVSNEYVAFVNPDLLVSAGALGKAVNALCQHPQAWIAGGHLLDFNGLPQRGGRREVLTPWRLIVEITGLWKLFPGHPYFIRFNRHEDPPLDQTTVVSTISGAFMVLPRQRWLQLGGMDEAMFLHAEDLDLSLRVVKAGGQVLYCPDAVVHHQQGSSDVSPIFVEWHKTRSIIAYFFKHFRDSYPVWSLKVLAGLLWGRFAVVSLRALGRTLWGRCRGGTNAGDSTPAVGQSEKPTISDSAE